MAALSQYCDRKGITNPLGGNRNQVIDTLMPPPYNPGSQVPPPYNPLPPYGGNGGGMQYPPGYQGQG